MLRRRALLVAAAAGFGARAPVTFPADFGAHPDHRTEWWYITGHLEDDANPGPLYGFQVTFFRSATGQGAGSPSRFAAAQLVFAHAAVSDIAGGRLHHDQRIARAGLGIAEVAEGDTRLALRDWSLARRDGTPHSLYRTTVASRTAGFGFTLDLAATTAPLLQGEAGISRKGPGAGDTSGYYSEPQLAVRGDLTLGGRTLRVQGRAWLDHEWSDAFLPAGAVGWDWTGINLDDGGALTAFRLRRADGSTVHAGGSLRTADGRLRNFSPAEVVFTPGRTWRSPTSGATYPVEWQLATPAGVHRIVALLDAQELDSRASTGAVYWEGLSDLRDGGGARVGRGYLEMTGYAGTLRV